MESKVFEIIAAEQARQNANIELIASENFVSENVMRAVGSCLTNKYSEGYPAGHRSGNRGRYYGGCGCVDELEEYCCGMWQKVFGTDYHVNVQPHSGSSANLAAYMSVLKPGDTILAMSLNNGGHLTHGSPVNFSGKLYNMVFYGVDDRGFIDYDDMRRKASAYRPQLGAAPIAQGRRLCYNAVALCGKRTIFMTETVLFILEIIGTAVFAASGALAGLQRQLDAFGVVILGVCTACGGGVIRDLTLGITPPVMFCQPVYALVAMGVSALVFLPAVRHLLAVESRAYELVMLWLDSIGLGLFTVVGVQCAFQQAENYNLFLLVFVGVITGVGGGVLRDVLSNQKPYIFVKHFYACPTLIGALLCALCWQHLGDIPSMLLGAAVILVLRLCAAHFRWGLPHAADLPE